MLGKAALVPVRGVACWERALLALRRPAELLEDDLAESFIRGSGKGGQAVNTRSSTVYLKHRPSGLEVKA